MLEIVYNALRRLPQRTYALITGRYPTPTDRATAGYFWLRQAFHFAGAAIGYGGATWLLLWLTGDVVMLAVTGGLLVAHIAAQETIHHRGGQAPGKTAIDVMVWVLGYAAAAVLAVWVVG